MSQRSAADSSFRADINGLRAWSVAAVIGYHFKVPGFSGGFIGVDVFFVISGFLMTGIVVAGLERGHFSTIDFYMARARRIVPALAVLCLALLVVGWFLLLPPDYRALGTHVAASMAFLSNFKFWDEAGYFDEASHEKWLLHTWSLSVEWQFYLLLPLLLWFAWRIKPTRRALAATVAIGLALSLAASVLATPRQPTAAFYLLHSRAWEMLGGGLVYLASGGHGWSPQQRRVAQLAGLAVIVGSVVGFSLQSAWPGWRAVMPVAAAMLIIAAAHRSAWTHHAIAQWMGLRSYSLYLWHWPIFVLLAYFNLQRDTGPVLLGLVLTCIVAELSYRWVEVPARIHLHSFKVRRGALALGVGMGALCVAGVAIWSLKGVAHRFHPAVELAAAEAHNINPLRETCYQRQGVASPSCVYGGSEWKVIGVGDSHLSAVITGLAAAQPNAPAGVVQWSYRGCLFVAGMKKVQANADDTYKCAEFIEWAMAQLETLPPSIPVVIVGRYAYAAMGPNESDLGAHTPDVYFSKVHGTATPEFMAEFAQHIKDTACRLARQRTVYLMRPIPEMGFDVPKTLSRRMIWGKPEDVSIPLADYTKRNAWVWAAQDAAREQCGARILDPLPYLCHDGRCYGSRAGRPLYVDDDHLSEFGNKMLTPMFAEVFKAAPPIHQPP